MISPSPRIQKDGESFTLIFEGPAIWLVVFCVGLCLVIFAFASTEGFGLLLVIFGAAFLLIKPRRVHFDASARTLMVEKGWCLWKKTYDLNLLKRYYIKSVPRSGPYCVFVLDVSGRMKDVGFGTFKSDGEVRRLMDLVGAGLGRTIPETRANGAPY